MKSAVTRGGVFTPDTRTLAAVAHWLQVPLGQIVSGEARIPLETNETQSTTVVYREGDSVPDKVEAHLRADRHLDGQAAVALAQLFRMAYEQFSRVPTERPDDEQE